ncbi:MAG: hypothetical protein EOM42_08385 [Negativicutes bacterium]|nr:hypothetical protein [Negativicutes bacterium]
MKILHIARANGGDAPGRFVMALMEQQRKAGHEAKLMVQQAYGEAENVLPLSTPILSWQVNLLKQQNQRGLFDLYAPQLLEVLEKEEFTQADIVHLHDISGGYFSYLVFPFLAAKPLIWTLYNERMFMEEPPAEGGQAAAFRKIVRAVQELSEYTIVNTLPWLAERIRRSSLGQHQQANIPMGVDCSFWSPGDKIEARKMLGLPAEGHILLVDATGCQLANSLREQGWLVLSLDQEHEQVHTLYRADLGEAGLRNVYRSVDLALLLGQQSELNSSLEISACGVPLAVPQNLFWKYPWLQEQKNGLALSLRSNLAMEQLKSLLTRKEQLAQWSNGSVYSILQGPWNLIQVMEKYEKLYRMIQGGKKQDLTKAERKVELSDPNDIVKQVCEKHLNIERMQALRKLGRQALWDELKEKAEAYKTEDPQRGTYVDAFLLYCIWSEGESFLWDVVEQWLRHRQMPPRSGHLKNDERLVALLFAREIRELWKNYLIRTPQQKLAKVDVVRQSRMVTFWRLVFLNDASILYLETGRNENILSARYRSIPREAYTGKAYPDLLLRSMYQPYGEVDITMDMDALLRSATPLALKVIVPFWLSCAPYFNSDIKVQKAALTHIKNYCDAAIKYQRLIPKGLFEACAEHFTLHLWRLSYCGGDMSEEINAFGRFLQSFMKHFYPRWSHVKKKSGKQRKKVRIGYISSNFRNQAVSFYMVNRILHANKDEFEVVTFSLERRRDEMTERIVEKSDEYIAITELQDLDVIAQTIVDADVDILIYTDIGMDPQTYKLAAMQLAPVQAVLVGHGVTTGLPTVQYYLSGDFEGPKAERHYCEKLIRLPRLGAAQYAPFEADETRTRKDFGLPEDKVLFVSCANGIKHGPARDDVLVRILQQASNAVIVLKPFMLQNLVDMHFVDRLSKKVRAAGVADRLRILPPLPKNTDLLALLRVCDVNLDTYPYGGWTTNMDALYVGLPVVTQEGELARTRWGAGMLRAMGIEEGIAQNEDEYVAWAVRYARDAELRSRIRAQVEVKAKEVLFDGSGTQNAYEEVLMQMYTEHASRKH